MTLRTLTYTLACLSMTLVALGCSDAPGKPKPGPEVARPEEIVSFAVLYHQNCAGCHGDQGNGGAAISLANPVYLATAGVDNIQGVISAGVSGTMMPAFAKHAGGMLTEQQIAVLAQGIIATWGRGDALSGATAPSYRASSTGDALKGQTTFATFCGRCHSADAAVAAPGVATNKAMNTGSLLDPAYLALVSDQSLRSTIIGGRPELGMPDWRFDATGQGARAMTDQEITDTVAWLRSHRVAMPGQPYPISQ